MDIRRRSLTKEKSEFGGKMANDVVPVRTNPVVFYGEEAGTAGWWFRGAEEDALHGPFRVRRKAVIYALKALTRPAAFARTADRRAA